MYVWFIDFLSILPNDLVEINYICNKHQHLLFSYSDTRLTIDFQVQRLNP
jgi:hypothetical protein